MLNQLRAILSPPNNPIDVNERILDENVKAIGVSFPVDYVEYSRIYGTGQVSVGKYKWEVWSAFRPRYLGLCQRFHDIWSEMREALETFHLPLGLFPEDGGLLPFAKCDNGVWFCWRTVGEPSTWQVVVLWAYDDDGFQSFDLVFSEFLFRLLTRQLQVEGYSEQWNAQTDISFTSESYYQV